jgi:DNA invertase Pin-like site-specific DNA recombinase
MKKAAIYCRVSTSQPSSLAFQEERCRALADEQGYEVVDVAHAIASGAENYTPLREWLSLQIQAGVEVIIAHAPDRLSRLLPHLMLFKEASERAGIEIVCVDGSRFDAESTLIMALRLSARA